MPKNSLKVTLKVAPSSKNAEVVEFTQDLAGKYFMKIKVKEPPQDGKANEGVIKLIAKFFDLPKTHIEIISGHTSKQKVVNIVDYNPELIFKKLQKNLFT